VSLGAALAELGYRVLVIDLDPQGNASTGMGIRHEARETTVYDVIVSEAPIEDAIVPTPAARLEALPSTIDLAGAEIELVSQFSREGRLKRAIDPVREGRYDFIFLDCPPSLGLLTVNALTAAEELIVPIQCEYYALEGLGQLLRNVNLVQQNINPELRLAGIVMTMFDPRTKLSEQVVAEVQRFFGELVYDVIIPRTVRLSEAPGFGQPITMYDPRSKGAECYRELAREVALRPPPDQPMPQFDHLPTVVMPAVEATPAAKGTTATAVVEEPEGLAIPTVSDLVEEIEVPAEPVAIDEAEDEIAALGTGNEVAAAVEDTVDDLEVEEGHRVERVLDAGPSPIRSAAPTEPTDDEELWEDTEEAEASRVRPPATPVAPGHLPDRRVVVIDEDRDIDIRASREPLVDRGSEPEEGTDEEAGSSERIGATLEDDGPKRRWRLFRKGGE
jgi:chromosome partitioning protein